MIVLPNDNVTGAGPLLSGINGRGEGIEDILGHAGRCTGQGEECVQVGVDLLS